MNIDKNSDLRTIGWVFKKARHYWLKVFIIFALSMLATPLSLLTPVPLMLAVDSVIGSEPLPALLELVVPNPVINSKPAMLVFVVLLVLIIAVGSALQNAAATLLTTSVGQSLMMEFRTSLFRHAQRLSATYHDTKGITDSIYRIQSDAPALQSLVISGVAPFFVAIFTLTSMLYIMASLDGLIALVAIAVSPLLYVFTSIFRKRLRNKWRDVKNAESSAQSVIQEVLSSLREVQAFGREEQESARFTEFTKHSIDENVKVVLLTGVYGVLVAITMAIGTALVLYLGVKRVESGVISVGQLLLVMSYLAQIHGPLNSIGKQITRLQGWLASAERVYTLLNEQPDVIEKPNARHIDRVKGEFRFENVSFSYDGKHDVLHDIDFDIPAGTRVGIAGHTGAGKSTLANLLMRFYDPVRGRILLDKYDLRDYRISDLRDQFGMVLQDSVLFSTSIADNIAYGKPEAKFEEIVQAAEMANASEFIRNMPDQYKTVVGERGMSLSGGQRQRIALARAFLRNAPILILDEPTSAVDKNTESLIMDALTTLIEGRTTFMIAHSQSTLDVCDVIIRLDHGQLKSLETNKSIIPLKMN